MLRPVLIALASLLAGLANAQSWCPPGATWSVEYADFFGGQYGITRVEYVGDTLLGGFVAQRLRETNVTAFAGTQDYIASSNSSIYTRFDDGIVYQWEASTSTFDTLMWFDAAPGQFWHAPLADNLNPSLRLIVVDTSTVLVGSVPLRRLLIQMGNQQIDTLHERVGFSFLYLSGWTWFLTDMPWNGTLCYQDSTISYVAPGTVDCLYTLSVEEVGQENTISVHPTPGHDRFTLELPPGRHTLLVNDLAGRTVHSGPVESGMPVDASRWPAGTYVLRLPELGRSLQWVKE